MRSTSSFSRWPWKWYRENGGIGEVSETAGTRERYSVPDELIEWEIGKKGEVDEEEEHEYGQEERNAENRVGAAERIAENMEHDEPR